MEAKEFEARLSRIEAAGLIDEYTTMYNQLYGELIPDPSAVGDMADAAVLDDCKAASAGNVCHRHGLGQYMEVE